MKVPGSVLPSNHSRTRLSQSKLQPVAWLLQVLGFCSHPSVHEWGVLGSPGFLNILEQGRVPGASLGEQCD